MLKNFKTYQLALEFYRKTNALNLKGEIRDQMERASLSVILNLGKRERENYREKIDADSSRWHLAPSEKSKESLMWLEMNR